jgi:hypothetical protein
MSEPAKDLLSRLDDEGWGDDSGDPLKVEAVRHIEALRKQLTAATSSLRILACLQSCTKRELQEWARDRRGAIVAALGNPRWLDLHPSDKL